MHAARSYLIDLHSGLTLTGQPKRETPLVGVTRSQIDMRSWQYPA